MLFDFNIYMTLGGNSAVKQKTVHSSMAYYVHALLYNATKHVYMLLPHSFHN
jgi:hypothetical protein